MALAMSLPRPYGQTGAMSLGKWGLVGLLDVNPFSLKQNFLYASSAICSLSATSQVALTPKAGHQKMMIKENP